MEEGFLSNLPLRDIWASPDFVCPEGYDYATLQTRKVWAYPRIDFYCTLPSPHADLSGRIGAVAGGGEMLSGACLNPSGSNVAFHAGSHHGYASPMITDLMPADYNTTGRIKLNRPNAELFIDGSLRGVILFGLKSFPVWENNPPYAVSCVALEPPPYAPAWIQIGKAGAEVRIGNIAGGSCFLASNGCPLPSRRFDLYNENTSTKWSGFATDAATITSHPVPIWGYPSKTVYFRSDGTGTLSIQVCVGGTWMEYDSQSITADTLLAYSMTGLGPIMRCEYTPDAAQTIATSEVYIQ